MSGAEVFHLVGKLSLYENIITAKLETSSDERIRSQLKQRQRGRSILHKTNGCKRGNIFRLKLFPLFRFSKSCAARWQLLTNLFDIKFRLDTFRGHKIETHGPLNGISLFSPYFACLSSLSLIRDPFILHVKRRTTRNNEGNALRCLQMNSSYFFSQRTNKRYRVRPFFYLKYRRQFQKNVSFFSSTFNYTLNSRFTRDYRYVFCLWYKRISSRSSKSIETVFLFICSPLSSKSKETVICSFFFHDGQLFTKFYPCYLSFLYFSTFP